LGKEYNPDGNSSDTNTEMYYSIYYIQLYTVYSIVYKIHAISDVTREREKSGYHHLWCGQINRICTHTHSTRVLFSASGHTRTIFIKTGRHSDPIGGGWCVPATGNQTNPDSHIDQSNIRIQSVCSLKVK
jgi:hypothetical protein